MQADVTTWGRKPSSDNKYNTGGTTNYTVVNDNQRGGTTPSPDYWRKTYQMINDYRNGLNRGGGGGYGSGGAAGVGDSYKGNWEDAYKKYIESLQKTRDEAMAYRKGLYEQALANNGQYYKDEQRLANREYYTRNRKLNQLYGNDLTGPGLSNRYASNAMLTNALTSAKNRQNSANKSAESEYHNALSNIQNAYAQGMYNAYGTEYGIDRNLEYQRYLLEHGYL